jgi:hypothetical protein
MSRVVSSDVRRTDAIPRYRSTRSSNRFRRRASGLIGIVRVGPETMWITTCQRIKDGGSACLRASIARQRTQHKYPSPDGHHSTGWSRSIIRHSTFSVPTPFHSSMRSSLRSKPTRTYRGGVRQRCEGVLSDPLRFPCETRGINPPAAGTHRIAAAVRHARAPEPCTGCVDRLDSGTRDRGRQ